MNFGLALLLGSLAAVGAELERRALRAASARHDPWKNFVRLSADVRQVRLDGQTSLRVAMRGSGRPVVCLHGWGHTLDTWTLVAGLLPAGIRLIAVDLRGHGGSSPVPPGGDTALMVDDVGRLLESLDLDDAVVVGHSLGGIVAQALAIERPDLVDERVRSLLLVSTKARGAQLDVRSRLLAWLLTSRTFHRANSSRFIGLVLARHSFASDVPMSVLRLTREISGHGTVTARRHFDLLGLADLSSELPRVKVPTTVLSGVEDPATPVRDAVHLAEVLPMARLRLLSGTGHLLPLERPQAVVEEIVRLIAGPESGGSDE
jgi:3-oxoadipate enol-lactonase